MHDKPLLSSFAANERAGYLEVESGSLRGRRVPLPSHSGVLLLGREAGCDLTFDHTVEGMVGRRHAQVEVRPDGTYLVDLNSVNGTFRTSGPVEGAMRLTDGERFQLGGEGGPWLCIHLAAAAQPAMPPRSLNQGATVPASPLLAQRAAAAEAPTAPFPASGAPSQAGDRLRAPDDPVPPLPQPAVMNTAAWSPTGSPPPAYGHVHPALPQRSVGPGPAPSPPPAATRRPTAGLIHHPLLRQALLLMLLFCGACALGAALGLREVWSAWTPEEESNPARIGPE